MQGAGDLAWKSSRPSSNSVEETYVICKLQGFEI